MWNVKVIGAGSIGNHLSHAARRLGWCVTVCDVDPNALLRMKSEIYPSRYGAWDETIQLVPSNEAPEGGYDLICIGTPPDVRIDLALRALDEAPKAVQLEKPVCPPSLKGVADLVERVSTSGVAAYVGYGHVVSEATRMATDWIAAGHIGEVLSIDVEFREHWGEIFVAHPWLSGPADTYLGYWKRGGGAGGEHSHATNLWQHLAHAAGKGKVTEVDAMVEYVEQGSACYDSMFAANLRTESGLCGRVIQDVITRPSRKRAYIQGTEGTIEWQYGFDEHGDRVALANSQGLEEHKIARCRPDDFIAELIHIQDATLKGTSSPLGLNRGLDTMLVVAAGHESEKTMSRVLIDYFKAPGREALGNP